MARKYKANILSQSSIKDLIKDLKEYRNSLDSKMKEFMDKLVDIAVKEIEANIALAGITVGSDGYFNCSNCSKKLYKELKDNEIDFENIDVTRDNVFEYFEKNNGYCE